MIKQGVMKLLKLCEDENWNEIYEIQDNKGSLRIVNE